MFIREYNSLTDTKQDIKKDTNNTLSIDFLDEDSSETIYYHGSVSKFDDFNGYINWLTTSYKYAEEFALGTGYVYFCYANLGNLFDVGETDTRVFDMLPVMYPFNQSDNFKKIVSSLNLSEDEVNTLIAKAIDEYAVPGRGYNLQLRTVVRTKAFRDILLSKGYDGIKAKEYSKAERKSVDTFGLFYGDDIEIQEVKSLSGDN